MAGVDQESVRNQSLAAYGQWKEVWREHAKIHGERFPKMKSFAEFHNSGIGSAAVCVAYGASVEEDIETLKAHQDNVTIFACDKSLGLLLDNGIVPDFCIVCDAVVSFEKYCDKWKDQLKDTICLINVCANPKWTEVQWKDVFFFANEDILNSELEFCELSGCPNTIPAGTNVSNAMVIMLTQSNNSGRRNFFGFDKILLTGFDYSFEHDGNYYAFDHSGGGKRNYMRHLTLFNNRGNLAYTSSNLLFSAKWLSKYVTTFSLPVVQCSKSSILALPKKSSLETQIVYNYKREDREKTRLIMEKRKQFEQALFSLNNELLNIGRDHYRAAERTL